MRTLKLSPSSLGLQYAKAELLTPFGKVVCEMTEGKPARIVHPKEIRVILE